MNDLITNPAQSVARQVCINLEDTLEHNKNYTISQDTQHVSYNHSYRETFKKFEAFKEVEHLRTFLALPIDQDYSYGLGCYLTSKVFYDLFPKLRYLRVFSLSGYNHLRYLNLSRTSIKWLPELISELYNLQTLILCKCCDLTRLSMPIGNLANLRHLDIIDIDKLKKMPLHMGNLVNLQTLSKFIVDKSKSSGIKELKNLLDVRGVLSILGLHNVVNAQDAMDVNLKEKCNIEELKMEWRSDFDDP
ncbi:hypothetical protein PVL29_009206 [Vitis rotundifolia]|uniref:Disease resistance R13L4/SHOC-2-like LRR domain-containing protein n=1 Tax=Vitis rotundifolia TaxID=103349 RepID=A0AA38ZY02_VITRO|nr:hypothetical protein PVL29_009206 [Vitis rotundifolia]